MLSFEDDQDLTQFLFTPEPQTITLMPEEEEEEEEEQARKRKLSQLDRGKTKSHVQEIGTPKDDQKKNNHREAERKRRQEMGTPKDDQKKNNHREAERKRRQEMALLYTSLRSKLPKEYLQNIGGLAKKRDDLKKLVDAAAGTSGTYDHHRENSSVKVECGKSGIQVILKTSSVKGFPLSRFLRDLNGEGMPVLNCTSTLLNEALIHVITCDQVDACDQTKLEKRLRDVVYIINPVIQGFRSRLRFEIGCGLFSC